MQEKIRKSNKPELGFGFMRLPLNGGNVDINEVRKLVDFFMGNKFSWFDTAAPYHFGKSEEVLRKVLVERFPRDQFKIADKLTQNMLSSVTPQSFIQQQMERTELDFFDRCLLHAMNRRKNEEAKANGY